MLVAGCLAVSASTMTGASNDIFRQTNLAADVGAIAPYTDPNLLNPWGVVVDPGGHVVVVDNHAGVATSYNRKGKLLSQVISIPAPDGSAGAPTDLAVVTPPGSFGANKNTSRGTMLLFSTEDGTIAAWNPRVNRSAASIVIDNSGAGANYKSLAISRNGHDVSLFVANFGQGQVEMYDSTYTLEKSFTDTDLKAAGYVPFGVRVIDGSLFVSYAFKTNPTDDDETTGPGLGYVVMFDRDGNLLKRFASQGTLNAPWGLAKAPGSLGKFSRSLLVGNFGDGTINGFNLQTGAFLGQLSDTNGAAFHIEGLWGLAFNHGASPLFFTAGPDDENHGVLGVLSVKKPTSGMGGGGY